MDIGSPYVISGTRSEHPHPTLFSLHSIRRVVPLGYKNWLVRQNRMQRTNSRTWSTLTSEHPTHFNRVDPGNIGWIVTHGPCHRIQFTRCFSFVSVIDSREWVEMWKHLHALMVWPLRGWHPVTISAPLTYKMVCISTFFGLMKILLWQRYIVLVDSYLDSDQLHFFTQKPVCKF